MILKVEIITSTTGEMELVEVVPAEVSPYDPSYPITFLSTGIKEN